MDHDLKYIGEGQLASCDVCCGGEGSLATECPGDLMTQEQARRVYDGCLDFVGGRWVETDVTRTQREERLRRAANIAPR